MRQRNKRGYKWAAGAAAALFTLGSVTACASGDDEPSSGQEGTNSSDAVVVEVTIANDNVEPAGQKVEASINEPVRFEIDSDVAGELHVHSKPEQEITFEAGQSTHELTFDKPGRFPVESHDLHTVIVELEVS